MRAFVLLALFLAGCSGSFPDFVLRHPMAAMAIGTVSADNRNISSCTVALVQRLDLDNAQDFDGRGSAKNAFRHTLWQAAIAARYGMAIAYEAGRAQEQGRADLGRGSLVFKDLLLADSMTDLRNNQIGREIGILYAQASLQTLAKMVLLTYRKDGLWQVLEAEAPPWQLRRVRLDTRSFQRAWRGIESFTTERCGG